MFDRPAIVPSVYRATVVYSSKDTGEIRVRIPSLAGMSDTVPISYIGRKAYNGSWDVPDIGSQIVVTSSDSRLYNVYWLQVNPDAPADFSSLIAAIQALQSEVDAVESAVSSVESAVNAVESDVSDIQTELQKVNNKLDALFLNIFQ